MKGYKLILCALCAFVTVVAAVTAVIVFRNEIADFFVEVKDKFEDKKWFRKDGEFADYADV